MENKQSNIVYINKETQSLMSEHDYKHLSTDQQNKMVGISLQKLCENNTTTKPMETKQTHDESQGISDILLIVSEKPTTLVKEIKRL